MSDEVPGGEDDLRQERGRVPLVGGLEVGRIVGAQLVDGAVGGAVCGAPRIGRPAGEFAEQDDLVEGIVEDLAHVPGAILDDGLRHRLIVRRGRRLPDIDIGDRPVEERLPIESIEAGVRGILGARVDILNIKVARRVGDRQEVMVERGLGRVLGVRVGGRLAQRKIVEAGPRHGRARHAFQVPGCPARIDGIVVAVADLPPREVGQGRHEPVSPIGHGDGAS